MVRLKVVSYNTYQEKSGRDPALDRLFDEGEALICLQEVNPARALAIRHSFGKRAFVSLARHGLQYLALVLPDGARFVERRTAQLNGLFGIVPRIWSLRRSRALCRAGLPTWKDPLEPRVAQVARVLWRGRTFGLVNTHLPLDAGLRNRCLTLLSGLLRGQNVLLVGDLNTTIGNLFFDDLILAHNLTPAGNNEATHAGGRRIDYVLFRGAFREAGYDLQRSLSDHRLLKVGLEV